MNVDEPVTATEPAGEAAANTEVTVRTLLGVSGLSPDDEEVAVLVGAYETFREEIAGLYTMPGVRYGAPGLVFDADPAFTAWA